MKDPASYIPKEKFAALHKAVLDACDGLDGVKDGVIENPRQCQFDPKSMQCPAATDAATCLTAPQVEAARKIYAPARNPRTGAEIFPGLERGSEMGWGALAGGPAPLSIATDHFKYIVFKNPDWDFKTLDFDKDVAKADADRQRPDERDRSEPAARSSTAAARSCMYHGWNDQLIAPRQHHQLLQQRREGRWARHRREVVRLFMAPGMDHCAGGDGPSLSTGWPRSNSGSSSRRRPSS